MPNLPTFTVSDATAQRLLAAFAGQVDETGAALTPQQAYKRWLKQNLLNYVLGQEARGNRPSLEADLGE
jgi:hypothetical protein